MKTAAIISEYNPFHLGHKYQVDKLHSEGYELIVAVMSGNITQRGELACADKFKRAEAAVLCGIDIVIELPSPFSCASAEYFAYAGVFAAEMLGADVLSFGSECGNLSALEQHSVLRRNAAAGSGAAVAELGGTDFMSNDILGIEYIRAIKKLKARILPITHKREGGAYLSEDSSVLYPSASAIRKLLLDRNLKKIADCMPKEACRVLLPLFEDTDLKKREDILFNMLMPKLMYTSAGRLSEFAFLSGGLAERLKRTSAAAVDLEDFYRLASTKVYTNGRIRRAAIAALCEISADALCRRPEYLTLLAATQKGRKYLSSYSGDIEICSNIRQKKKYPSFEYEQIFDSLYSFVRLGETGNRENYSLMPPYMHQS